MLWWTLFRLRSGSKTRQAALRRFTAAPDPRAVDALVNLVEHGAGDAASAAAFALAALGGSGPQRRSRGSCATRTRRITAAEKPPGRWVA
jgi:HEAT repeat protein